MRNKVILTDADGVLFDWVYAFDAWMARHGNKKVSANVYDMATAYGLEKQQVRQLIRIFNESSVISNLPPLRDAIKYIRKLHEEHGYVFHCISSLSDEYTAQTLRTQNIKNLFGNTAFEKFVYLDTGEDKDKILEQYRDTECVWVEDKIENAELGYDLGLDSLIMSHPFNSGYNGNCKLVANWKEIYEHVTA